MNKNGRTTCNAPGQEQYEKFTTRIGRKQVTRIQYDYRSYYGQLFSCVGKSLAECRKKRNAWIAEGN
jgi:hypothetical protein